MTRVANSTIKGFLYQFNLTLKEILESEDEEIQIEGLIEDIDIISDTGITAIQCKYHEAKEKYSLSDIYKPVLQMIKNYILNPNANVNYVLYAYFPNEEEKEVILSESDIVQIIETQNIEYISEYISYIKECKQDSILSIIEQDSKTKSNKEKLKKYFIENDLNLKFEISEFLKKFKFVIGKKYEELEDINKKLLQQQKFSKEDVEELFLPNSIQLIAELSIEKKEDKRKTNKKQFINILNLHKQTAITRWTKELSNYKKLLEIRRKQLKLGLDDNYRERCFILVADNLKDFDNEIINFLNEYVRKYCWKVKLHRPVTVCIVGEDKINELTSRLYTKNVLVETGYRGEEFFESAFNREPERKVNWIEFNMRLTNFTEVFCKIINENKPDDLFIIGNKIPSSIKTKDTNIEILDVRDFEELKYLLRLREGI